MAARITFIITSDIFIPMSGITAVITASRGVAGA
jgi:hypothetical protein